MSWRLASDAFLVGAGLGWTPEVMLESASGFSSSMGVEGEDEVEGGLTVVAAESSSSGSVTVVLALS
jgi:hypothetical protein